MILIDKGLSQNKIYLTLNELTTIEDANYLLVIHSSFTNKTFRVLLPENVSTAKTRYDAFLISSSIFNDIEEGVYTYSIYQTDNPETDNEIGLGKPVEVGYLKFVSSNVETVYKIEEAEAETEDDYITYKND